MSLRVLSVAYPLAPVRPDSTGGAEQILSAIDRALVGQGHRSVVIACEGSNTEGELVSVHFESGPLTPEARSRAQQRHTAAIEYALRRWDFDIVHLHGIDFAAYLPPEGVPALVTLHLPIAWYPPEVFRLERRETWLHCVSASQERDCSAGAALLPYIANGVETGDFDRRYMKRGFALALGRVCAEKGFHLALDAAREAGWPLLIAGEVYRYPEHERYFSTEIQPRLDCALRFIGPVRGAKKRRVLASARCLLAPSLAAETSSLVAMEALASGTPVIAFRSGALPEIVEHGKTGFVVENTREMAAALRRVDEIDPETCRRTAHERFSADRMTRQYINLYGKLSAGSKIMETHHAPGLAG
jgi:glycosyltransferase involved in cell wall biosynthesis